MKTKTTLKTAQDSLDIQTRNRNTALMESSSNLYFGNNYTKLIIVMFLLTVF